MKRDRKLTKLIPVLILAVVLCFLGVFMRNRNMDELDAAAARLTDCLAAYKFDGIELEEGAARARLYEYISENEASSPLARNTVAELELDPDARKSLHGFKAVKSCYGGIFFATSVPWEGKWSGLYAHPSKLPAPLQEYQHGQTARGHWQLKLVPDDIGRTVQG